MTIFEELKARYSGKELEQALIDNCDEIMPSYAHTRQLTDEQLNERREKLSELLIEIDNLEQELKAFKDSINLNLKPKRVELGGMLTEIRNRYEEVSADVFVYLDHEMRRAFYVDNQGNVVNSRPLRAEERQGRLRAMND